MSEKKCLARDEEKKEVQNRRHEEAKQKTKKEVPKHTAQRRLFTLNQVAECKSVCHICSRRIKHGHMLHCEDCQN
jgi:hypothetical protein